MADTLLPPPLTSDDRFQAVGQMAARVSAIDLSPLLVYLVDTVDSSALVDLAEQFHVMGTEGWNSATTEETRRALIKSAIELHRHKGTPYAVSRAIELMGLTGRPVEWFDYGGAPFHFKISAAIPPGRSFTETDWQALLARVEDAKNIRSHFEAITLHAETAGTSHRALRASGRGNVLSYPDQPAQASTAGEKRPVVWASGRADLHLYPAQAAAIAATGGKNQGACATGRTNLSFYPRQPSPLAVASTRVMAQAISATTTSTLYPAPA